MILDILASSTNENLTTLDAVKDAMEEGDSKHDKRLKRQIVRSSRQIETYLGRGALTFQRYRAILPGKGGATLRLPRYPIRAVVAVFDGSDTGSAAELRSTDYRVDYEAGFIERPEGFPWTRVIEQDVIPLPGRDYRNWLVEWSAGYAIAGTSSTLDGIKATGPSINEDIEQACIEATRTWFIGRQREPGVSSLRVGDLSVSYKESENRGLPDSVTSILDSYRSVA